MVILINSIVMDLVSLIFQEVLGPYHLGQEIIHFKNIGLSWTLGVQDLFTGLEICTSCAHCHEKTSVAPHVLVNQKLCINAPLYIYRLVYLKDQW